MKTLKDFSNYTYNNIDFNYTYSKDERINMFNKVNYTKTTKYNSNQSAKFYEMSRSFNKSEKSYCVCVPPLLAIDVANAMDEISCYHSFDTFLSTIQTIATILRRNHASHIFNGFIFTAENARTYVNGNLAWRIIQSLGIVKKTTKCVFKPGVKGFGYADGYEQLLYTDIDPTYTSITKGVAYYREIYEKRVPITQPKRNSKFSIKFKKDELMYKNPTVITVNNIQDKIQKAKKIIKSNKNDIYIFECGVKLLNGYLNKKYFEMVPELHSFRKVFGILNKDRKHHPDSISKFLGSSVDFAVSEYGLGFIKSYIDADKIFELTSKEKKILLNAFIKNENQIEMEFKLLGESELLDDLKKKYQQKIYKEKRIKDLKGINIDLDKILGSIIDNKLLIENIIDTKSGRDHNKVIMSRKLAFNIFFEDFNSLDLKNASFSIINNLMYKMNIKHSAIEDYVENRDQYLDTLSELGVESPKLFMIKLSQGGRKAVVMDYIIPGVQDLVEEIVQEIEHMILYVGDNFKDLRRKFSWKFPYDPKNIFYYMYACVESDVMNSIAKIISNPNVVRKHDELLVPRVKLNNFQIEAINEILRYNGLEIPNLHLVT